MVEEHGGIDTAPFEMDFEVEVLRCGATRSPRIADDLTSLDMLADLDNIPALMTVEGFEAIGVTDDDAVAITIIGPAAHDDTVEGGKDGIIGTGLDVHTGMIAAAAIGTDDMTAGEGIGPVILLEFLKVKAEGAVGQKGIIAGIVGIEAVDYEAFAVTLCYCSGAFLCGIAGDREADISACSFADEGLLTKLMTAKLQQHGGINTGAIDHDGEEAVDAVVAFPNDGDRLSGTDMVADIDEVLCVVGVDGLQSVVVADDDDVAILCGLTTQSDGTVEHGLDGIALTRRDLQKVLSLQCLSHRQWE